MIYCSNCGKRCKEESKPCPECGHIVSKDIKSEDIHPFVQSLHKKANKCRGKIDTGLSFIVIGLTLLIIGVIFYYLAFKKTVDPQDKSHITFELNFACAEFYVFLVGVIAGGLSFLCGLVLSLVFYRKKRVYLADMDTIRENKNLEVGFVKPVCVTWGHKIKHFFKKVVYNIKRKKQSKASK